MRPVICEHRLLCVGHQQQLDLEELQRHSRSFDVHNGGTSGMHTTPFHSELLVTTVLFEKSSRGLHYDENIQQYDDNRYGWHRLCHDADTELYQKLRATLCISWSTWWMGAVPDGEGSWEDSYKSTWPASCICAEPTRKGLPQPAVCSASTHRLSFGFKERRFRHRPDHATHMQAIGRRSRYAMMTNGFIITISRVPR